MFGWVRSILDYVRPKAKAGAPILPGPSFDGADLSGRDFSGASLENENFTGAKLDGVNLSQAKLDRAIFRNASLRRANLSDASGVRSDQFPSADLTGAKLPETAKFETLAVIKDASDQAKTLFIALIAACAFSWLTIGATRDASLLSNSSTTPLPIINVPLPIDNFYMVAPVLLLIAFLYFHLSLQRLWEQLADLPAFFPDGNAADKRIYPWLLSGLMRSKIERLGRDPRAMGKLQTAVSVLLAYALAPLTLIGFWGRYLPAHDWIGTGFHAGLVVAAAGLAVAFWRQLGTTFAGKVYQPAIWPWTLLGALLALAPMLGNALKLALPSAAHIAVWVFAVAVLAVAGEVAIRHRGFWRALKHGTAAVALVAVLVLVSVGSIEAVEPDLPGDSFRAEHIGDRDPRRWIPRLTSSFSHGPIATLTEADVSTKPANWGEKENLDSVKGANLRGRNLRYVHAERAFLAGADLRYGRFDRADLRNADFSGADLTGAIFAGAKLEGAILLKADVFRADFVDATGLTDAQAGTAKNFRLAWWPQTGMDELQQIYHMVEGDQASRSRALPSSDFRGCDFSGHEVPGSKINMAAGGDFRAATFSLHDVQAPDFVLAQWDPNTVKSLSLPPDHNDRLKRRDFTASEYSTVLKLLRTAELLQRTGASLDLSGFRLDGLDLKGANFTETRLASATFRHASLEGAILNRADIAFADFTGASGLSLDQIKSAKNWQLSKYDPNLLPPLSLPADHNNNVDKREFRGYQDLKLTLTGTYRGGPLVFEADLTDSDFRGVRGDLILLRGSKIDNANVAGVQLTTNPFSLMERATNWQLVRLLPMIVRLLDKARYGSLVYGADLSNAYVARANLRGMNLRGATFKRAGFHWADLREAKFEGSDLDGAEFSNADIRWTDFRGAKNLTAEQIRRAHFWRSAYYDDALRKELGLPDNQNQIVHRLETFLKDAP